MPRAPVAAMNDPMMVEQAIVAIETLKLNTDPDTDPRIEMDKMDQDLRQYFSGSTLTKLQGQLAARVQSPDAGRESIRGAALKKAHEWALGNEVSGAVPRARFVEKGPTSASPSAPSASGDAPSVAMAKWLKTTREDLDDFLKISPAPTREDAMDFVAQRVIAANVEEPGLASGNTYAARDGTVYDSRAFLVQNGPHQGAGHGGSPTEMFHGQTDSTIVTTDNLFPGQSSEYSEGAKLGLRVLDLPFRVLGGIAAGGDPVIQYQYQTSPFQPVNSLLGYDAPPTQEEARSWTEAQISFNDALATGIIAEKSPALSRQGAVRIKMTPARGDGTLGLIWVLEPGQLNPSKVSDKYQLEFPNASDIATKGTWVPALGYQNPNSKGYNFVRYDAIKASKFTVYDAKWSTTGHSKQRNDVMRQIESLLQNPGWSLVVEVPNEAALKHAQSLYESVLNKLPPGTRIPTIQAKIVPPGSRNPNDYDSMPTEQPIGRPPPIVPEPLPPGHPVMSAPRS
jgi:hypothetical protein